MRVLPLMRCRVILVTAALLGVTAGAAAQTLGEITGWVRDSSGAVIPGATVAVTNPATNATRTVMSNEAGVYHFPALQPGTYTIKVEMAGFRTITQTGVELQVQQSARLDFSLQVGQVTETIEVSGTAALIASENATVGTVIENKRVIDLPLNGRNFLQLVSLSSNVSSGFQSAGQAGSRQGGTRSTQNISVAGQRSMFNRFTLDGVENTDVNFNTYVILPSVDALQEFKVQSGIFPAEFGRATRTSARFHFRSTTRSTARLRLPATSFRRAGSIRLRRGSWSSTRCRTQTPGAWSATTRTRKTGRPTKTSSSSASISSRAPARAGSAATVMLTKWRSRPLFTSTGRSCSRMSSKRC